MANKGKDDVMIYRNLGSTGEKVSLIGIGGWHLGLKYVTEKTALRIMDEALARGITFFDNCWDYNEGESEKRMGGFFKQSGARDKVFLMTKIDGRTKKLAASQIDESLRRLKTDMIDLVQHTKFCVLKTRTGFLTNRKARISPCSKRKKPESLDLPVLQGIKTRRFICIFSKRRNPSGSGWTRRRCR